MPTTGTSAFPITPAPATAFVIPALVLLAVGAATWHTARNADVPWPARALIGLVTLGGAAVVVASALGARGSRVDVGPGGLRLRGDLYGRTVPADRLRPAEARVVDLAAEPALRPVRRSFGTALPGYAAGWFRLADGSKALLSVTDRRRVAYVPTSDGYALLLSAADPHGLVATLRAAAPASR